MAEKQPLVVVKKITIAGGGAHGGSWKVAFADFMTAMMAFFLLMWLLNQAPEVKKNVSDYFSTPSVIEYNFSNYGVQLTLEKLFLDLINEPLRVLEDFIRPMDYTPNFMSMGSENIVKAALMEQVSDFASDMKVEGDTIQIEIPERQMFKTGTAEPTGKFAEIMGKLQAVTMGLEDTNVYIDSDVYWNTVSGGESGAKKIAEQRLDMVISQIDAKLEHQSVDLHGRARAMEPTRLGDGRPKEGIIKIIMKQKDTLSDGSKPRKLNKVFGKDEKNLDVYNNFVNKLSNSKDKDTE
ncbi:MAG TPA: chemotaxis protein MotB [Bdellovibrionales bacterium]|nr:chemotaxis protein MotB [Pseudobdellovibrionaceae bacterium]HAG92204.1 chemotaxis protein MotB [Bdellovibrionales bacterium]|tara:strand:+ start:696 stop:1577 length:882 start_codon:yes stop_codon:yes gene_type:complete